MKLDFHRFDEIIQRTIGFRKVRYNDVELVHKWMNKDHVHPFWNLNLPMEQFKKHFHKAIADKHQTLYLGLIDGHPISYWESYWVNGDIVGNAYTAQLHDQGVHLLIGETDYLGLGYALPLLRSMVQLQFLHLDTNRIVAEPDIRNDKMIYVFEKCGFKKVSPITLPDKTAMLMFCERSEFEKRWNYDQSAKRV